MCCKTNQTPRGFLQCDINLRAACVEWRKCRTCHAALSRPFCETILISKVHLRDGGVVDMILGQQPRSSARDETPPGFEARTAVHKRSPSEAPHGVAWRAVISPSFRRPTCTPYLLLPVPFRRNETSRGCLASWPS
ncbi:hypothetical protein BCR34DRAFT_370740 [Clohesyomyces aquaticus]|uniref:Uncharacterized protein n=1 Tax=Clohesyomyces aquaticus TaxID=1231657 RepID=A0A1Y1ZI79_9PLEO|nr:hypothetical protein BCR34DRAFT_370740 [Clohesyomyces aquaticus]